MKFRFKLQRALDFAHMRERRKQNQLHASEQRERILGHYLLETREKLRAMLGRLSGDPTSPMATFLARSIESNNADVHRLEISVDEEKNAQVRLKQELIRLVMRRKALETLKEKKYADHRFEQRVREQKTLDEVSTVNWQRVQKENESND